MILKTVYNKPLPDERIVGPDTRSMKVINGEESSSESTSKFTIFPNPGNEYVYLNFYEDLEDSKIRIELLSIDGKILKTLSISSFKNLIFVPLTDLPDGTYFIKVSDNEKLIGVEKLAIVR